MYRNGALNKLAGAFLAIILLLGSAYWYLQKGVVFAQNSCVEDSSHEGIDFKCDQGIYYIVVDAASEKITFDTVMARGYDRFGHYGECRDVNVFASSTALGCQSTMSSGTYPAETVDQFVQNYPYAVVAINADLFGSDGFGHGPEGLTVVRGQRLDGGVSKYDGFYDGGLVGDDDANSYLRPSLLIRGEGSQIEIEEKSRDEVVNISEELNQSSSIAHYQISAVGGCPMLVIDGKPNYQGIEENNCARPDQLRERTALGITADGKMIIVVVPSDMLRQGDVANWMVSKGIVQAINLDGGTSTQLWYSPKFSNIRAGYKLSDDVINSGGPVANALVISHKDKNDPGVCQGGAVQAAAVNGCDVRTLTPTVAPTPTTRPTSTPVPPTATTIPQNCSQLGPFDMSKAYLLDTLNCGGNISWFSDHPSNGPSASGQASLFVPQGAVVRVASEDNNGGRRDCFAGSVRDLAVVGWQNAIQWAQLEVGGTCVVPTPTATARPVKEVKFFANSNWGGGSFTLGEGDHYPNQHGYGDKFPNFDSIDLCTGCSVSIFDSSNHERCWGADEDGVASHGTYGIDARRIWVKGYQDCEPWLPRIYGPQHEAVYKTGSTIVFNWGPGDDFADRFTFEVWRGSTLLVAKSKVTDVKYTLTNAQRGNYLMRLQSHWGSRYSTWHDRPFSVKSLPEYPIVITPELGKLIDPGEQIIVSWQADSAATSHRMQIWCDEELQKDSGVITGTSWNAGQLTQPGVCYIYSESYNEIGASGWLLHWIEIRSPEPKAVENLSLSEPERNTLQLSWSVPTDLYRNYIKILKVEGDEWVWWRTLDRNATTASDTLSVTSCGQTQLYEVYTVGRGGETHPGWITGSTTCPAVPSAPVIVEPDSNGTYTTNDLMQAAWEQSADTLYYDFKFEKDGQLLFQGTAVQPDWFLGKLTPGSYTASIQAIGELDAISAISTVSFTVVQGPTPTPRPTLNPTATTNPAATPTQQPTGVPTANPSVTPTPVPTSSGNPGPQILSPIGLTVTYGDPFSLSYSEVPNTILYEIQMVNVETGATKEWKFFETIGQFDLSGYYPDFGTYDWHVRAYRSGKIWSDWSSLAKLTFVQGESKAMFYLPVIQK